MVLGGAMPVGSSRVKRLDPLALPVRFTANDAAADEQQRQVEISHDRVVLHRAVRGMRMALKLPVAAFLGVALRRLPAGANSPDVVAVSLEHRDPGLSVPLFEAADSDDVVAEWQLWARVLGCPLLLANRDGTLREPFRRLGHVRIGAPALRRRRRTAIRRRRPTLPLRRHCCIATRAAVVHHGEREIIARS